MSFQPDNKEIWRKAAANRNFVKKTGLLLPPDIDTRPREPKVKSWQINDNVILCNALLVKISSQLKFANWLLFFILITLLLLAQTFS